MTTNNETLRGLPAVHRFLSHPQVAAFEALLGKEHVKRSISGVLEAARRAGGDGVPPFETLIGGVLLALQRDALETLVPAINGTGVLLQRLRGAARIALRARYGALAIAYRCAGRARGQ